MLIVPLTLANCGFFRRDNTAAVKPVVQATKTWLLGDALRIASAPKTVDEFTSIYPDLASSTSALRTATRGLDEFQAAAQTRIMSPSVGAWTGSLADNLLSDVRATHGRAITFVGHNDSGIVRFGDGSSVSIQTLGNAVPADSFALILSCEADNYLELGGQAVGPFRTIDYFEAAKIEGAFFDLLPKSFTPDDTETLRSTMVAAVAAVDRDSNRRSTLIKLTVGGGVVTGGGGVVYLQTRTAA